jgi:hypothetical protein
MLKYLFVGLMACQGCSRQPDTAANAGAPTPQGNAEKPSATAGASPSANAEPASPTASAERKAGAKQPKWTRIEGVRSCTGTILSNFVCTPTKRPPQCSEKAWQELLALSGAEALTPCALEPELIACSVPLDGEATVRCLPPKHPTTCPDDKWARVKDDRLLSPCP